MNDKQFEHAIRHFIPEIQEQMRARDTAQREAIEAWKAAQAREAAALAQAWELRDAAQVQLAQIQAEMPDLRANMTKALDLLQVLTSTKYTDRAFVEAVDDADEMLAQLRGKVVLKGLADQQEAQGAQAGDEHENFEAWHRSVVAGDPPHEKYHDGSYVNQHVNRYWTGWQARAALAAQPAAGEPIQVEAVAVTREDEDGLYLDWVLEGGISALEAPGVVLLVAHGTVTDGQGSGEVYLAPPAAAHGDEAVRKDAERYRWLRNPGQDVALVLDKKTGHVPVDERGFGGYGIYEYRAGTELDEAIDAAMRAQGDGGADHA